MFAYSLAVLPFSISPRSPAVSPSADDDSHPLRSTEVFALCTRLGEASWPRRQQVETLSRSCARRLRGILTAILLASIVSLVKLRRLLFTALGK